MKLLARGALIAAILMALLSVQPPLCVCGLGCFPASCRAVGCSSVFSVILLRWSPINYMMGGGRETKGGTEAARGRILSGPQCPAIKGPERDPMRPQPFFRSGLWGAGVTDPLQPVAGGDATECFFGVRRPISGCARVPGEAGCPQLRGTNATAWPLLSPSPSFCRDPICLGTSPIYGIGGAQPQKTPRRSGELRWHAVGHVGATLHGGDTAPAPPGAPRSWWSSQ